MPKQRSTEDRIADIIIALRAAGEEPTYPKVAARLRPDKHAPLGCSPNAIYAAFDKHDVAYGRRSRVRPLPEGAPENPFIAAPDPFLHRQRPACFFCRYWRVGLEDGRTNTVPVRMECRRGPPGAGPDGRWPVVAPIDWCGEFSDNGARLRNLHPSHLGLLSFAGDCPDDLLPALGNKLQGVIYKGPVARAVEATLKDFTPSALTRLLHGCQRLSAHNAIVPPALTHLLTRLLAERGTDNG